MGKAKDHQNIMHETSQAELSSKESLKKQQEKHLQSRGKLPIKTNYKKIKMSKKKEKKLTKDQAEKKIAFKKRFI